MLTGRIGIKAVIVALESGDVHIYRDRFLVDVIRLDVPATCALFGRFGREENALVLISRNGGLSVRMLRRTAQLGASGGGEDVSASALDLAALEGGASDALKPFALPKVSALALENAARERDDPAALHRAFQADLYRLRLRTARDFVRSLEQSASPISITAAEPVRLQVTLQGIGVLGPKVRDTVRVLRFSIFSWKELEA